MKMRIIAITCALSAAACGGSDKPAQDPSTATTETTTAISDPIPATPTVATSTPSTTPATANDYTAASTSLPAQNTNAPAPSTNPAPAGATVANNPGVADQTKNADNTKINDRDRHGALTPMDQGSSGSETKITASIRKGIMGDKSLSFGAKNVKVITVGSKVTLRGPVKSDQEKATIETLAKQAPGVSEVDNQLEVKK